MSLFDDSRGPRKPFFVCNGDIPRRKPSTYGYFAQDFDLWEDRVFLCFVRDKLCWIHGYPENDPMIEKLLDIIYRTPRGANSTAGV